MTIIKDGAGTGKTARVNAENRLDVESVARSLDQHINELYEKQFSLTFEAIDPTGADDYFFYCKNTGTKNLHMSKFRFRSTVVGIVELHYVTGTASSGTTLAPVNRTLGSSNTMTALIETDPNFTGLTNAGTLVNLRLDTADKDYVDIAPSHIIIPPGQAIAFLWDTSTGALSGTVDIYEDQGIS
jgi:hypothetical protein